MAEQSPPDGFQAFAVVKERQIKRSLPSKFCIPQCLRRNLASSFRSLNPVLGAVTTVIQFPSYFDRLKV